MCDETSLILDYFGQPLHQIVVQEFENCPDVGKCQERIVILKDKQEKIENEISQELESRIGEIRSKTETITEMVVYLKGVLQDVETQKSMTSEFNHTKTYLSIIQTIEERRALASILSNLKAIQNHQYFHQEFNKNMETQDFEKLSRIVYSYEKTLKLDKKLKINKIIEHNMSGLKEELGNILTQCFAKLLLDFNEKKYVILFRCVESLKINTDFQIIINNCLLATTNQIFAGRDIKNLQLNKDDSIIRKLMRKNLNKLAHSQLLTIFQDLCNNLWNLIKNVILFSDVHREITHYGRPIKSSSYKFLGPRLYSEDLVINITRNFGKIIEKRLIDFVTFSNCQSLSIEEFIEFDLLVRNLVAISKRLFFVDEQKINQATIGIIDKYIKHYHESVIDELFQFLEYESWEVCPVLPDIHDFNLYDFDCNSNKNFSVNDLNQYILNGANPFHLPKASKTHLVDKSGDLEEFVETTRKYIEFITQDSTKFISNTFQNLLRIAKRYILGMSYFRSIWSVTLVTELFDLIIYFCVVTFCDPNLLRIPDYLNFIDPFDKKFLDSLKTLKTRLKNSSSIPSKKISLNLIINCPSKDVDSYTSVRIVAIQSFQFTASFFFRLRLLISSIYGDSILNRLNEFYGQLSYFAYHFEFIVLHTIAQVVFEENELLSQIKATKFDIKDITSIHSPYVDNLITKLKKFKTTTVNLSNLNVIENRYILDLWNVIASRIAKTVIEGYSIVKKCTNEGRALMQLDFRQLSIAFQTTTSQKMFMSEDVELYIKAAYLNEKDIEELLASKRNVYSTKQIKALLNSKFV